MNEETGQSNTVELTAGIVSAFVAHNKLETALLSKLIGDVHLALARAPQFAALSEKPQLAPAVPIKETVTANYIICLEDGRQFKSLKRHLNSHHGMTPGEYRAKWDLPGNYPMAAPSYAKKRSALARRIGLGRKPASSDGKKTAKAQ